MSAGAGTNVAYGNRTTMSGTSQEQVAPRLARSPSRSQRLPETSHQLLRVEVKGTTEASSLPGQDSEGEQCDWSESEATDVEIVEALPAKREVEDTPMTWGVTQR